MAAAALLHAPQYAQHPSLSIASIRWAAAVLCAPPSPEGPQALSHWYHGSLTRSYSSRLGSCAIVMGDILDSAA